VADDPLWHLPVRRVAELIGAGELSAVDAVSACLARIAAVNPVINAVVRLADDALERARAADADRKRGAALGPLHGVPFTLKDSFDTAGLVTTVGTVGWRDRIPERDATVAARLKAAGAILLGKTNTPEFTWSDETDNDVYGVTSNPYDPSRTPGGSSGGAGAIVAAGGSFFDIGSDSGDSIRQPAHVCGVAGLKPTNGRVPLTGHWPGSGGIMGSLTALGPIARHVDDLAWLLPVIAGPDGQDPRVPPVPVRDDRAIESAALRCAVLTDNGIRRPTEETVATVQAAASALEGAGAHVEQAMPPALDEAWDTWDRLVRADGYDWLRGLIADAGTPGMGSYETRGWIDLEARPMPGAEVARILARADAIRARLLRWFADFDVIVCPVMPQPAIRHGESNADWFGDTYSDVHNLTGWPAVVVRGGASAEGLPIGVQLVAPPWREDLAIAAARVVEAASGGWQRPPI
jgi:amidase